MFELVKALNDGAEALKKRTPNPISLNAGCELFIAFVTLFPHDSDVSYSIWHRLNLPRLTRIHKSFSELKTELIEQGQKYTSEALGYRDKIADLSLGFIKDDSVVCGFFSSNLMVRKW